MTGERDGAWGFDGDQPELVKYEHADDYGHTLLIRSSYDLPDTACVRTSQAVWVTAADLPGIVAGLYRAAGQPNPLADRLGQHVMQDVVDRRDLLIEPSIRAEGAVYFGQSSARGWHVRAEDLPELVGALYEAAGQEPPILMPRRSPEMSWITDDGYVRPLLMPSDRMTSVDLRDLAAWYASAADLYDTVAEQKRQEAEREQVKRLAEVIRSDPWRSAEEIAAAVLAAGYARTEKTA